MWPPTDTAFQKVNQINGHQSFQKGQKRRQPQLWTLQGKIFIAMFTGFPKKYPNEQIVQFDLDIFFD